MDLIAPNSVTLPQFEVCLTFRQRREIKLGVHRSLYGISKKHMGNVAKIALFQGLFSDINVQQSLIQEWDCAIGDLISDITFAEKASEIIRMNILVKPQQDTLRIAIKKHMDEEGRPRYGKYIDVAREAFFCKGGDVVMNLVLFWLIRACDMNGFSPEDIPRGWLEEETCKEALNHLLKHQK